MKHVNVAVDFLDLVAVSRHHHQNFVPALFFLLSFVITPSVHTCLHVKTSQCCFCIFEKCAMVFILHWQYALFSLLFTCFLLLRLKRDKTKIRLLLIRTSVYYLVAEVVNNVENKCKISTMPVNVISVTYNCGAMMVWQRCRIED